MQVYGFQELDVLGFAADGSAESLSQKEGNEENANGGSHFRMCDEEELGFFFAE